MSEKSTPPAARPSPPRFVVIAAIALLVAGLAGVLAGLSLRSDSVASYINTSSRDSLADTMQDKLDDARDADPAAGGDAAEKKQRLDAVETTLNSVKQTPIDGLDAKSKEIIATLVAANPAVSKDGKEALGDLRDSAEQLDDVDTQIGKTQSGALISSLVLLLALGLVAGAAYKGKHWARWAVIGLWVLVTFTNQGGGLTSLLSIGSDVPALYKIPSALSGLGFLAAVVLINLRPSVNYLNLSKPVRAAGAPARRGLFSPPPPRKAAEPEPTVDLEKPRAGTGRSKSKQRSNADAVAKGADLARSRAKAASKSRRTSG